MDTRPTRTLTTEGGHTAVILDYVTGNEARVIKAVSDAGQGTPEAMDKAQDKAIEIAVLSLDGSSERILERLGELPLADYAEVIAAVTELLNPKKKSQQ